jgi:hypothetical protein
MALGQFIEAFTRAENQVYMYLIFVTKVDKMIGKALFERDKCENLLATLTRVWDVAPPSTEIKQELTEAIRQLKAIQKERNTLVHSISFVYPDKGRVGTNRLRARAEFRVVEPPMSPGHLDDMSADLGRIKDHFFSCWFNHNASFEARASRYRSLAKEWRYKPRPALLGPIQQHGRRIPTE